MGFLSVFERVRACVCLCVPNILMYLVQQEVNGHFDLQFKCLLGGEGLVELNPNPTVPFPHGF